MSKTILTCASCARRAVLSSQIDTSATAWLARQKRASRQGPGNHRRLATVSEATIDVHTDAPRSIDVSVITAQEETRIAQKKAQAKLRRNIKASEKYLEDPWHLGNHVQGILKKDRFDEAYQLTQQASKDKQVVVSWNHLIEYLLEHQQLKKAVKVYNDMKKRAQLPNVQTYTVMFRGMAKSQHPKIAVAEAMKHYNLLMNDKRLHPNSIHLNAALNVCARAGDLDSMFLIANTVNDTDRAATAYTYTTILNALRYAAVNGNKDLSEDQMTANIAKSIERAKGLWEEVVQKWRKGKLIIDEELVCAMGRILLTSPTRAGKREVFDLLEQTMNLPNLAKHEAIGASASDALQKSSSSKKVVQTSPLGVYAVPGRNTLALLLTILASSRESTSGLKYWDLLTRQHGITPDNDNWLRLLGMLKVARSSAQAATMINAIPADVLEARHYRIAMETCLRDGMNENAVKNSNLILDSMLERFFIPDLQTMRQYLEVALNSHSQFRTKANAGSLNEAKREYGLQLTAALARLWDPFKKMHYYYFKDSKPSNERDERRLYNMKREVIALARHMVSTFNKVISESMLSEQDLGEVRPVAAKINREIQAFYHDRETVEPRLVPRKVPNIDRQHHERKQDIAQRIAGKEVPASHGDVSEKKTSTRKERNFASQSEFTVLPAKPWITYENSAHTSRRSSARWQSSRAKG